MKDIRQQWKALAAEKKIKSEDIAALCLYRAINIRSDVDDIRTAIVCGYGQDGAKNRLLRSFKPITNQTKLINGADPQYSLKSSLNLVKYSSVAKWLAEDDLAKLLELAKTTKAGLK